MPVPGFRSASTAAAARPDASGPGAPSAAGSQGPSAADADLAALLAAATPARGRRRLVLGVLALALAVAAYVLLRPDPVGAMDWETATVRRGDLAVTVTATGALEPRNQVDVGTEVSGTIETVNVDYNDQVRTGDVLARLDTDRLDAQVAQSRASLASARARVADAEATRTESAERLARLERVAELSGGRVPSEDDLATARARLARAEAGIGTAQAAVVEAGARLALDETNLRLATIRAPIDGIVLRREVSPDKTVAASLQTPVLFTVAETLANMELVVAIDEADIGQVAVGQTATFGVDAWPGRRFPARIEAVRFAPVTTNGVVTYEAVLSVDNDDLALRPGMTATADIVVAERTDALLVPNRALRFVPPGGARARPRGAPGLSITIGSPSTPDPDAPVVPPGPKVWVLENDVPMPRAVTPGASDGLSTELLESPLAAGDAVLIDYTARVPGA